VEVTLMYGTVMVAQLKEPTTADELRESMDKWRESRPGRPGLVDAQMLLTEDGGLVVSAVRFASKEDYWAMADDVAHDEWFATKIAPLLDGDPTWMDGNWIED
jgi:hypothetical protein